MPPPVRKILPATGSAGAKLPAALRVHAPDLDNLRASGLSDETIRANELRTEYDANTLAATLKQHVTAQCCLGGLVFPYRNLEGQVNGFARVRPHHPRTRNGKPAKYEQPAGSPVRAYYPAASVELLRDSTGPVYVTEGEKKALALSQLGLAAVGIGGIWNGTQKTGDGGHELIPNLAAIPWNGRLVYVVFDYDVKAETRQEADAAGRRLAQALRAAGAGEVYCVELPPAPDGGKHGVDDYLVAYGAEAFGELVERAQPVGGINGIDRTPARPTAGEAIQLIRLIPPTLAEDAYHGIVGDFLRAVAQFTEATDAGVLAHLLPALGCYIGPGPTVFAGSRQPPRVNTVLVGPTSTGRKGTAFAPVDLLMERVDGSFWEEQRVGGLSTGEGLIAKVADKKKWDQEAKEEVVEEAEKRLYVLEEEFSKVLAQARRDGNILSQVVREAFDSGALNVLTRGAPLQAKGVHISVTGHITPEELAARLCGVDMANGFGNRFLWFVVKSDKVLPKTTPIPDKVFRGFADRLAPTVRDAARARPFILADDAEKLWEGEVYATLREDRPGLVGAMTARGSATVLRLSLIYALLDEHREGDRIHIPHLRAALAVWNYSLASAGQLFGDRAGTTLEDRVLAVLATGPKKRNHFTDHINRPTAEIDTALRSLEAAGRVRRSKERKPGAGRPAEVWELAEPSQSGN